MASTKWYVHPVVATGVIINVFILGLAVLWANDNAAEWRLLVEDGIVEWMQFLCFALLSGLLGFLAVEQWQREPKINLQFLAFAGLCALVGLAALEEISWFQRVLHIVPPEFFAQNNRQGETNLHNLAMGKSSLHKAVLLKVIAVVGLTHNVILPLLARKRVAVRDFVEKFGLYLPPLSASLIYIVLVALSHLLVDHPRKGELGELFGAMHYLVTVVAAYFFGVNYGKKPVFGESRDSRNLSTLFCMILVFILLCGWMLSAGAGAGAYIASHPGFGAE
ncbi:hypothetical protein SAMN05216319_1258 [Duganella sp. CF402]|uniref:hypothetical protein n=1 Tax=unclassified Duganella TaxID=2636909 RepID=UPI0008C9B1C4|nr:MULTISPECIES: hypothetical protein [unclassified Duganella]RZT10285.1 hypothetical protein EV582_2367 [Duganella sp. BK701]SEL20333.1 hypothetical protein SAMN05216319_1258 [Duganella sp. CF402]